MMTYVGTLAYPIISVCMHSLRESHKMNLYVEGQIHLPARLISETAGGLLSRFRRGFVSGSTVKAVGRI